MKKRSLGEKLVASPYIVWAALFIIVPLIFVAYYSVTDSNGNFTLEYIADICRYKDVMLNSIWLGFIATVISLVLAYPLAYIMARSKANVQRTIIQTYNYDFMRNKEVTLASILEKKGLNEKGLSFLTVLFVFEVKLVVSDPLFCNLCRHSLDILGGILGISTAAYVEEVVAALGNEEALLIACGIAVATNGNLLDEL